MKCKASAAAEPRAHRTGAELSQNMDGTNSVIMYLIGCKVYVSKKYSDDGNRNARGMRLNIQCFVLRNPGHRGGEGPNEQQLRACCGEDV
jgi:hypothetical protein